MARNGARIHSDPWRSNSQRYVRGFPIAANQHRAALRFPTASATIVCCWSARRIRLHFLAWHSERRRSFDIDNSGHCDERSRVRTDGSFVRTGFRGAFVCPNREPDSALARPVLAADLLLPWLVERMRHDLFSCRPYAKTGLDDSRRIGNRAADDCSLHSSDIDHAPYQVAVSVSRLQACQSPPCIPARGLLAAAGHDRSPKVSTVYQFSTIATLGAE